MILDMNIKLEGIDEEFLEDLDDLIEDTRVEYFIINPETQEELETAQNICTQNQRFKYTFPAKYLELKDDNAVALKIQTQNDLDIATEFPLVIESMSLDEEFIDSINKTDKKGIILNATQNDSKLENFILSISKESLNSWEQRVIKDIDYNRLGLQSDYPDQSYDQFLDVMLKELSDMTFRAEQTIAAGGTRSLLKLFKLL